MSIWGFPEPENKKEAIQEYSFYLKSMRESCGMSARAFCKALGVTTTSYTNYEHGKVLPRNLDNFHRNLNKVVSQHISDNRKTLQANDFD